MMANGCHFENKIEKSPYLGNGLTDHYEIRQSDAKALKRSCTVVVWFSGKITLTTCFIIIIIIIISSDRRRF